MSDQVERPDDFKLPGGTLSYGELKVRYSKAFADKAFAAMERIQAEEGNLGELFDLYFDFLAQEEGVDHVVLGQDGPRVHHADPEAADKLALEPLAKGGSDG
jgi:hypothetical protein